MGASGHWMPIYWADYLADTTHLTTEEHGAYLLLIATYWRRGSALPAVDKFLASSAKSTIRRWVYLKNSLSPFFEIDAVSWTHKRLEKELLKSSDRLASARANGKAGGLAKSKLLTITTTEERKILDFSLGKGGGRRGVEMTPENRLSIFHNWLAPLLGEKGWEIISEAMNPQSDFYAVAVETCRLTAKQNGKGWPHQWPSPRVAE